MADGLQVQHHRSVPWICGSGKGMVKRGKIRGKSGENRYFKGKLWDNMDTYGEHPLYIYISMYLYISIYLYVCISMYIHTSIYLCISMCISMYIDNII